MAGKTRLFASDFLSLVFQGVTIANIANNASSGPLTSFYLSLHTADPTAAGDQTSHECGYTPYARVAIVRSNFGFIVSSNLVTLFEDAVFPECTSGSERATYYGLGTAFTGAGKLMYYGPLSPTIAIAATVIPKVKVGSSVTEN